MFLAAVIQITSTSDVEKNLGEASALIERAAGYGARLVATPENTNFLGPAREKVERPKHLTVRPAAGSPSSPAACRSTCCSVRSTNEARYLGGVTTPASCLAPMA